MKPYSFNDGTHVKTGDWACVPQRAIMHDSANYPHGDVFDSARFVKQYSLDNKFAKASKYTDVHPFFPFWGLGKQAW